MRNPALEPASSLPPCYWCGAPLHKEPCLPEKSINRKRAEKAEARLAAAEVLLREAHPFLVGYFRSEGVEKRIVAFLANVGEAK